MLTMCNAPLAHVEIPRPRDATELNNIYEGMIKFVDVHYRPTKQNRIYQFSRNERDLINDDSAYSFSN